MLALLRNPGQLAALRADPALLGPTIEECHRYEPPLRIIPGLRVTLEDVTIGGVVVPAGETVVLSLAAATATPQRFPARTCSTSAGAPAGI